MPRTGAGQAATLEVADASAGARQGAQQRKPADAAEAGAAAAGVRVFGHVRDMRGEPINNSGGTFSFKMAKGAMVSGDVPVVEFFSTGEQPQQVEGARLEINLPVVTLEAAPELQKSRELELTMDALSVEKLDRDAGQELLGNALQRMVLSGSTNILFADAEGCQVEGNPNADGSYAAENLHAGKWHTIVTHDNKLCRRQEFEIEKGEHQHQLDIVLDDELSVRVKLRTPDGRELTEAIAADPDLSFRVALSPVALRPGSAARFLPEGENQNFGCGRYEPRGNLDEKRRAEIGEASGVLTIGEAPPLEVGLVMCGQLIARRPLSAGQEEVEFVLSLEDLRRCFATALVRVVDAQTHAPIVGADVSIDGVRTLVEQKLDTFAGADEEQATLEARFQEDKRKAAQGPKTDAQGQVRIPWVLAGKHQLFAQAQGFSAFSGRVEIEAGGTCELKPVELTGKARISGHIFDAQGKPVQTSFEFVPLDRYEDTHESLSGIRWSSSEQGTFEVPEQRRERYVLRGAEGDGVLPPVVVDATQGDVGDLDLHLQPATSVQLRFTREPKEGAQLRVTTATGLPVAEQDLSGLSPAAFNLAPGSYTAEVREGAHKSGSVRFVVGKDEVRVVLPLD
jgi:hypothetical protein